MKTKIFFLLLLILIVKSGFSQIVKPYVLDKENQEIIKISKRISNNGWVYIKDELNIKADDLIRNEKKSFGFKENDELILKRNTGDSVFVYKRFHNKVEVENSEFIIHTKNGKARLCYGEISMNIISDKQNISESQAFDIVKKITYPDNNFPKEIIIDSVTIEYRPKGKLVYSKLNKDEKGSMDEYRLCYKFNIITVNPFKPKIIYISAFDGSFIKEIVQFYNASGTAHTEYNNDKGITTYYIGFPHWDFRLQDRTRGFLHPKENATGEFTYNPYTHTLTADWDDRYYFEQEGNTWGPDIATSALWAIEKSHDYFKNVWGISGTDGSNKEIRIYPNAADIGAYYFPADFMEDDIGVTLSYDGIYIGIQYESGHNAVALDILGHEFTHGIIHYSTQIGESTNAESGGLCESFCDIFGELIQSKILNIDTNWKQGYEVSTTRYRDFQNPIAPSNEDWKAAATYGGDYWDGDAHAKAGVQDRWFYLLSNSIGIDKAAWIAFTNMTTYLYSTSDYEVAREGSLDAALDRWGSCSDEYRQVMNAWAAVGVGDPAGTPCPVSLSLTINCPCPIMLNQQIGIYAIPHGGTGNYSYQWQINNTNAGTSNPLIITFDENNYYASQQISVNCQVYDGQNNANASTVYCTLIEDDPITGYIYGDEDVCLDSPGFWNSNVSGGTGSYIYEWFVNDVYVDNAYALAYYFDSQEYSSQDEVKIDCRVTDEYTFESVDLNTIYCTLDWCFKGESSIQDSIKVSPNPTSDFIEISINDKIIPENTSTNKKTYTNNEQVFTFFLIDNYGRTVYQKKTNSTNLVIPVSEYLPGIYHLKVIFSNKVIDKVIIIAK